MSANALFSGAEAALVDAVITAFRGDPDIRAVLGDPPRVFDDETRRPAFPYAVLERHECRPANASGVCGAEHRLTFSTHSQFDGRGEAKAILGAFRAATDRLNLTLTGQRLILAHVVYSDAMRAPDRRSFRGVIRIRILIEEA